jgi:DNA (cytosine-5)-methyltransferase 1
MVDFFAGVGCFSAAGHAAGFETIAALEINQAAADCYARHFPGVQNLGDINAASPPTADLWTGGFPCQDLSPAGSRAGLDGKRSGLIWRFLDLAAALRPRWILLENSTGLLTVARGRNAWRLFAALDDIGYMGAWRVMDSRYFGIPQGRRRVFILARDSRAPGPSPEEVLFDGEGGSGDAATGGEEGAKAAGRARSRAGISRAIATRPCQRNDPDASGVSYVVGAISDAPGLAGALGTNGRRANVEDGRIIVGAFNAETITSGENRSGVTPHAPTLSTRGLGSVIGSFNADMIGSIYGITPQAIDGPGTHENMAPTIGTRNRAGVVAFDSKSRVGPGNFGDTSPTLRTLNRPGVAGKEGGGYFVRRFTPLECERIQGIPDSWTAGQSDARRYHQIGNACPPPMIEWILRRLANATSSPL